MSHAVAAPQIGIALAAYKPNPGDFARQLESIRAQTQKGWLCIITVDSPLAEFENARELEPFRSDPRFRWFENPKRLGFVKNFEGAVARVLAEGVNAVALSDQDDIWYPTKLEVLAQALSQKPPLSLVHSDMDIERNGQLDADSGWTQEGRDVSRTAPTDLLLWNMATGASMLFDAELARRYPKIPDGVRYHDHFYSLAASLHGGVHPVHERLYAYRQHATNVIGAQAYRGLLGGRSLGELLSSRLDAVRNYESLAALARYFSDEEPALLRFISEKDFGARLLVNGARELRYRGLARESFALGCGKLLLSLMPPRAAAGRR